MSFVDAPTTFNLRHFFISIDGEEKTGKTTLALTAKGPTSVLDLNDGLHGVVHKAATGLPPFVRPKKVRIAAHPLPDGNDRDEVKAKSVKEWNSLAVDFREAVAKDKSVIVDSGSDLWRLDRQSEFGGAKSESRKGSLDYDMANSKIRGLLRLYHAHKANVILTHQLEEEWKQVKKPDGTETSRKTGKLVRDGFKEIGFMVQMVLRTRKEINDTGLHFVARLEVCRFDPALEGTDFSSEVDMFNLPTIMAFCTGTEASEWE
jgi:hypothetical protein